MTYISSRAKNVIMRLIWIILELGIMKAHQKGGPKHPTNGCVRTTDEAMAEIVKTAKDDPLKTLTVEKNKKDSQ